MKLIGEVYRLPCPHCRRAVQIVLEPRANYIEPRILEDPREIPENLFTSCTFRCPHCDRPIVVLGKLIFVVGDVEEFDEIEQHR